MARKRFTSKTYLKWLIVVGVLAAVGGGAGTFATFNAQVTNHGNTFETGSLVLSDTVNSGSACYSSAGTGNVNSTGCDALFTIPTLWAPGASDPTPAQLTLSNTGSIDASALKVWAPLLSTSGADNPSGLVCNYQSYTPSGSTHPYVGSGNPCSALEIQIQEYTDGTFGTAEPTCVFPVNPSASCGSSYSALSSLPSPTSELTVPGGLTHATSRYFEIGVHYPGSSSSDNEFQSQQTFFDLTWHIDQ